MKRILLISFLFLVQVVLFAATKNVTPADYESVYNGAANGDILLLDAGTYGTALNFPDGKAITLKASPTAATMPVLTFGWITTAVTTAGSSLILDGLEINPNVDYYTYFAEASLIDKFILKNCVVSNIHRCIVRASNAGVVIDEILIENCILKDCGSKGYCLNWSRNIVNKVTVKNSTISYYGGEGFFLAQNNPQTHAFAFNMQNNTIFKSGKDGSENYGWCSILIDYAATSTYNISNNIFYKPFTTADTRSTIVVPAGSGTVTCKNNLVVDYPNFEKAPAAGWDISQTFTGTQNYFKDTLNRDFTLEASFPFKGTDGNYLGDPRWWPKGSSSENFEQAQVKVWAGKGFINVESALLIRSLEMYNLKGEKMFVKNTPVSSFKIASNEFSEGIYILKIATNNKITTQKVVLLN